ncbi:MAG: hypothetical protein EZS28_003133 [Streblomastix strix]|uniref:Uncharacterized protein n=1 Tax=Streblomastix strix TaxID=222440 RepID=A0A5J4X2T1_9EUKA|nr:MAG: hypothetical protein EZS28_003133 [Streblomastix strix]
MHDGDLSLDKEDCLCSGVVGEPDTCICDTNPDPSGNPLRECYSSKVLLNTDYPNGCRCPVDSSKLKGIPTDQCECQSTGDIRAGTTCPVTEDCIEGILDPSMRGCFCTENYQPDNEQSCVCDKHEDATFMINLCRATKTCTSNDIPEGCTPLCTSTDSEPFDILNSCFCTDTDYPNGCRCPVDSSKLKGIPTDQCECQSTGDIDFQSSFQKKLFGKTILWGQIGHSLALAKP